MDDLTPNMRKALRFVCLKGHPKTAYGIGVSTTTMQALCDRGLIRARRAPGNVAFPRNVEHMPTAAGIEIVKQWLAEEKAAKEENEA